MDRKAGYKECQRCGLRNKPSALQCDFCGLRFAAGEDWDDNIQALEKMGGHEERVLVDEDVSKRIEATIVKRDKINAPARVRDPEKDDFDYFKKDPARNVPAPVVETSTPVAQEKVIEAAPEQRSIPPEPVQAAPERGEARQPMAAEAPQPVKEKRLVRRVVRPTKPAARAKTSIHWTTFSAVLMLGAVWYLVAIMYGEDAFGRIGGWALVSAATLMMVVGAGGLIKGRSQTATDRAGQVLEGRPQKDVLMCPQCHELVTATDRACPDCGAEFGAGE